jgi:glycosyltransferase involved in cell wall biosynthesis
VTTPPRLLLLGPMVSIHVRRWAELAREIGFRVFLAGDVHPGFREVDFDGVVEETFTASHMDRPGRGARSRLLRRAAWLRWLVMRLRPDVIHAHWLVSWGFWAAYARCRPLLVSAWGSDVYLAEGVDERHATYALRHADRVTASSPALAREAVRRGAPPERVAHLHLGVDLEQFTPASDEDRERARRNLGLGEEPVVLSPRGGSPNYNLPTVVNAFRLLRHSIPEARLLIVHGRAPLSGETRRALQDSGVENAIRVDGDVPHDRMADYFRAASVGVSIPSSDSSPRSAWEALACGLPMVMSDLPQVSERLTGTSAARLVPVDETAVAKSLAEVLTRPDLARTMSVEGRRWAVANEDHRESLEQLSRTYAALMCG